MSAGGARWADNIMIQYLPSNFTLQWKDVLIEDKMILVVEDSSDDKALIRTLKENKIDNRLAVVCY